MKRGQKYRGGRQTVTISFSCKPSTYKKIIEVKEEIEADRMETVAMSSIIDRLVNLGFAHREVLRLQKQSKLDIGQTEIKDFPGQKIMHPHEVVKA